MGQESKIAKEAKADYEYWEKRNEELVEEAIEAGEPFACGIIGVGPHTELWAKHLAVNEQLLGHFYAEVAGEKVEKEVLDNLLSDFYDRTIFTNEEELFLKSHFKEMVDYIYQTPYDDLRYAQREDQKEAYRLPKEVLTLIANRINIPEGARVYNPFTGFGLFADLYKRSKLFYEKDELIAWQKIYFLANGIEAEMISDDNIPTSFDAAIAYIPFLPKIYESVKKECDGFFVQDEVDKGYDPLYIAKVQSMYDNIKENGEMVIVTKSKYFWNKEGDSPLKPFWNQLILENAIVEIIQLPSFIMYFLLNDPDDSHVILVAKKGRKCGNTTMIDATDTCKKGANKRFPNKFDLDAFSALLNNSGMDPVTGLRKIIKVPATELKADMLLPKVYVIEKPSKNEHPRPLSDFCSLISTKIADADISTKKVLPWVRESDLSAIYHGALDFSKLSKIGYSKEFVINTKRVDITRMDPFSDGGYRSLRYRVCTYVDGHNDVVVFSFKKKNIENAFIKACDTPIAVDSGILVLQPNKGVDTESILSLIRMPIVYRQIQAYQRLGIGCHLNDILVPTDKRIIHDERQRMLKEQDTYKAQHDKFINMKTEYINEVRMRKHDMGQYIFELMNIEDLMRYYLENRDKESNYCQQIESLLDNLKTSIGELSTLLDNLSKEEEFGEPIPIRIDEFLPMLSQRHKADGYNIEYYLDKESIKKYEEKRGEDFSSVNDEFLFLPVIDVSPIHFKRLGNNILDNAKKHGFIDANRNDYIVKIEASIDVERNMFQIDFRNNGSPLPQGMNKMRYGIKGEKAGKTAGTGLGGNYVKSFVEHYGGDYDIFMDGEWTVVRIYLPIK